MKHNFESFSSKESLTSELQEEFGLDSGFDLDYRDPSYDSIEVLRTDDKIIVGLLQHDQDAQDYFENDDGAGEFIEFRSAEQRDNEISKLSKTKKLFYVVNKYDHGNVHYSVGGSKTYPDERWDVSHGCAIFIPCDYIQTEFRKMKRVDGIDAAYEHFIADSNKVLDNYSDWCNGEVYGYSVLTFDKEGNELDCDECWGFIGSDYAKEEKQSVMKHIVLTEQLNKLMENVVIETVEAKNVNLPFKITKKDLEEIKVAHVYDTYCVAAKYSGEDNAVIYNWKEGDEKPTKAKFAAWQKEHGTTADQFLTARLNSDIKDVLRKNSIDEEPSLTNKIKP